MAHFRRLKDFRSDLTVIEVHGELTHGEFIRFLEANRETGNRSSKAILDFRSATLSSRSKHRIKKAVAEFRKYAAPELRAALVFSNPTDYSVGKVISKAISKQGYLAEIRGFYNLYLAKAWLLYQQPVHKSRTSDSLVAF